MKPKSVEIAKVALSGKVMKNRPSIEYKMGSEPIKIKYEDTASFRYYYASGVGGVKVLSNGGTKCFQINKGFKEEIPLSAYEKSRRPAKKARPRSI